jgi:hypothetical protein
VCVCVCVCFCVLGRNFPELGSEVIFIFSSLFSFFGSISLSFVSVCQFLFFVFLPPFFFELALLCFPAVSS